MMKELLSGSDARGRALGEGAVLTPENARRLGAAFAAWLRATLKKERPAIAIGRDSRLTGEALLAAFAEGAMSGGARALDFGLCTTPAMYMALLEDGLALDASCMVTASHLPYDRNGFKFFLPEGGLAPAQTADILALAEDMPILPSVGKAEAFKYLPLYCAQLKSAAACSLSGLRVMVDAGSGAGGFYAEFLQSLGADTAGSVNLTPDGRFPAHAPNPEDARAMDAAGRATVLARADMGVIFDADCDRAAIIAPDGEELNRNRLLALASVMVLRAHPGATIVTDSVTSKGLTAFIQALGGVHHRYKRGYRNVIDEAKRLNAAGVDCPLAIETSGHAALRDNHFLDDGMYLATLLLCEAARAKREGGALTDWLKTLKEPVESVEVRLPITEKDFREAGKSAISALEQGLPGAQMDTGNREGVRLLFPEGFVMLRLSVHDPVLPLNAEADVPGALRGMLAKTFARLRDVPGIDSAPLEKAIENMEDTAK